MIHTKGKTFTIERSKWLRGEGMWESDLLRHKDDKMCCLGQVCEQLGFPLSVLRNKSTPMELDEEIESLVVEAQDSNLTEEMMAVNDQKEIPDSERESSLSKLAQQAGFSLKFVD